MKPVVLITEGISDRLILSALLPRAITSHIEFISANGFYSALTIARSLLAMSSRPVALILDSDTTDNRAVEEKRETIESALKEVASDNSYYLIFAVPEIESLLTNTDAVLNTFLSENSRRIRSGNKTNLHPKQHLLSLSKDLSNNYIAALPKYLSRIPKDAITELQRKTFLKEIINFVSKHSSI